MEVSDEPHAPAALPPASIKQESEWATERLDTVAKRRNTIIALARH